MRPLTRQPWVMWRYLLLPLTMHSLSSWWHLSGLGYSVTAVQKCLSALVAVSLQSHHIPALETKSYQQSLLILLGYAAFWYKVPG